MDVQKRKARFLKMWDVEQTYKTLFLQNPDIYFSDKTGKIYRNWEEFKSLYRKTARCKTEVPETAPTFMAEVLSENNFFLEDDRDVSLLFNARYCPPFWHHLGFIKIMYVLNGQFLLYTKPGKKIELTKGNFVIVPPDMEQSVFSYHEEDLVVNIFLRASTFEKAFSSLLMESKDLAHFFWRILYGRDDGSIIWFRCETDPYLDQFVLDMYEEMEKAKNGINFLLISYSMAFLAHALYYHRDCITSIEDVQLRKDKFPSVIQYIRENYNTVTLSSLAEHFQKSEAYLCRYIKKETGYSMTHLLREFRIRQAAVMMRDTNCSVEEIMLKVGYTDISYFYKVFKEQFGMTPNAYRKKIKIVNL